MTQIVVSIIVTIIVLALITAVFVGMITPALRTSTDGRTRPPGKNGTLIVRWILVGVFLLTVVILAYFLGQQTLDVLGKFWQHATTIISTTKNSAQEYWSLPIGLLTGILLILAGLAFAGLTKKWMIVGGVAVVTLSLAFSGFGTGTARVIKSLERCIGQQDCGPSEEDIPTISTGMVILRAGDEKVFYADGKVVLRNVADCYRLSISPPGVFNISWSDDAKFVYIEAKSGEITRTQVTSERGYSGACANY